MLYSLRSSVAAVAVFAALGSAAPMPDSQATTGSQSLQWDARAATAAGNVRAYVAKNGLVAQNCSVDSAPVRRDWDSLSDNDKLEYINAVKCLQKKPALVPPTEGSGVISRYDEFGALHINKTLTIHGTANFLPWHRYYMYTYEKALREECGYTNYLPYYNWARWASDPKKAPIFDGSATSMGGNGEKVAHSPALIPSPDKPFITLTPEDGGGCVTSGPFTDYTPRLGPLAAQIDNVPANPRKDGLGNNTRCLRRDISTQAASTWSSDAAITQLFDNNTGTDIYWFQTNMQGDFPNGILGLHTAGHFTVGGDPGGDLFTSPGDPYFFLHHTAIDRTYWIWQNLNVEGRAKSISGTRTLLNLPPSPNATLDDALDFGYLAPSIPISAALSTINGAPFCYMYT